MTEHDLGISPKQEKRFNGPKMLVVFAGLGLGTALAFIGLEASPDPTFAAGAGDGSNASDCGAVHGAFADVNGNFGFLGPDGGTPGYHGAVGQTPPATGYNNSNTNCQ